EALINMGKKHLIGDKATCLVPADDVDARTPAQRRKSGRHGANRFATKHTNTQPGFDALRSNTKPHAAKKTSSPKGKSHTTKPTAKSARP
ncbi:hypothetical protein ABLW22_24595, partial [Salmonella enterica]